MHRVKSVLWRWRSRGVRLLLVASRARVPLLDTVLTTIHYGKRVRGKLRGMIGASPGAEDGPMFVSADASVVRGSVAAELLARTNDAAYVSPAGVVRVDRDRWREAQQYEETTWMVRQRRAKDDRNTEHFERFDGFRTLEGRAFTTAIEVGCGPFTNLRLLLPHVDIGAIDLLDPLIDRYLEHPNCTYRDLELDGTPVRPFATALEDFQPDKTYDLVVMINVIEHCFDADLAFAKILELVEPEGVFVFHDKLYQPGWIQPSVLYDAGHPLRVGEAVIEEFLRTSFTPIFERRVEDSESGPLFYFIGSRKPRTGKVRVAADREPLGSVS